MQGGKALPAVVLVVMLLISGAAAVAYAVRAMEGGTMHSLISSQASSTASSSEPVSTEYLSSAVVQGFTTSVWFGQATPQTSAPQSATGLSYVNASLLGLTTTVYNGFTLFEPGKTDNATQSSNASLPSPTLTNAWGWLSPLSVSGNVLIPNGTWTFNIGLNVTSSSSGGSGRLAVGVAVYTYNGSNKSFSLLFSGTNSTFNLRNATGGNQPAKVVVAASGVDLTSSESLFVEYYLMASSFTPSNSFSATFLIGGANGGAYNFTYPDFGWINGTVSPSNASLTIAGKQIQTGTGGKFNVTAPVGADQLQANRTGYANVSETVDVVSGASTPVTIVLKQLFSVSFTIANLTSWKSGTTWAVQLNGTLRSTQSTALGFDVTNGTYNYTILPVSGYKILSPSQSSVIVNGASRNISVEFQPVVYNVEFLQTGIGNGTKWGVDINGNASTSKSSYLYLNLSNGTYSYTLLSVPGFVLESAQRGTLTVNGSAVQVPVAFSEYTFALKVIETGLPAGTNWSASVGGTTLTSKTSTMTFNEPNGTYSVAVTGINGYNQSVSPSTLSIFNGSRTVDVNFSVAIYNVIFRESGLPSDVNWSVTVGNATRYSTGSTIVFYEPDGSYVYSVSQPSGFNMTTSDGILHINGSGLSVLLNFTTLSAPKGAGYNLFGLSSQVWMFVIIVGALIALEIATSVMYFRKGRHDDDKSNSTDEEEGSSAVQTNEGKMTVTQMLMDRQSQGWVSSGNGRTSSVSASPNRTHDSVFQSTPGLAAITKQQYVDMIEGGNSYAVFEPNARHSMELFEAGLTKGFKGLCFTRQYPEKIGQKFAFDGTSVFWLTNIGSENSIRPKDLEKITLQCNEYLNKWKCIILIDGLEYLITNNGFLTVLKMLQFLRDSTAVNKSILILSINPNAIGENEVNLIMREVDNVLR